MAENPDAYDKNTITARPRTTHRLADRSNFHDLRLCLKHERRSVRGRLGQKEVEAASLHFETNAARVAHIAHHSRIREIDP